MYQVPKDHEKKVDFAIRCKQSSKNYEITNEVKEETNYISSHLE
jgi:hypothetical protein